jgi:hypothetical protein
MTDYRIKELGSSFVIAADGQDVLRCADENIARQIVRDAAEAAAPALSLSPARPSASSSDPVAPLCRSPSRSHWPPASRSASFP